MNRPLPLVAALSAMALSPLAAFAQVSPPRTLPAPAVSPALQQRVDALEASLQALQKDIQGLRPGAAVQGAAATRTPAGVIEAAANDFLASVGQLSMRTDGVQSQVQAFGNTAQDLGNKVTQALAPRNFSVSLDVLQCALGGPRLNVTVEGPGGPKQCGDAELYFGPDGSKCNIKVSPGDSVRLTMTPANGLVVGGWKASPHTAFAGFNPVCGAASSCDIPNAHKVSEVRLAINQPAWSIQAAPGGTTLDTILQNVSVTDGTGAVLTTSKSGSICPRISVGAVQPVTITARDIYMGTDGWRRFSQWNAGPCQGSSNPTCSASITSPTVVTPGWSATRK